jgi:hypothetical protein
MRDCDGAVLWHSWWGKYSRVGVPGVPKGMSQEKAATYFTPIHIKTINELHEMAGRDLGE